MREINVALITDVIEKLCIEANNHLPSDVKDAIRTCRGCEDGEISRTLSYDFSDVDFAGNIFCITGHIHKDLDFVTQTDDEGTKTGVDYDSIKDNICDNAILCLLLEDDNVGNIGTIDEHSFTILTITEENTLVATRIGRQDGGWAQKIYNLG